ncbi:MAG: hypothetical protein LKKZDAJK_000128 [Candidatus Fervidibacter sp.]|jgi:hypothetical protein
MQREISPWTAVVVVAVVIVLIGVVYVVVGRLRTPPPPEPRGITPPPTGKVQEGQPYGKSVPPGAPPFLREKGAQPGGQ